MYQKYKKEEIKMKTIGFPINTKENEKRRAIELKHIILMENPEKLYFQKGYGKVLGVEDKEYLDLGCNVCSLEEVLTKDIICDPKIGDSNYLDKLKENQTIFGWVHAAQNRPLTDLLVKNKITAIAWENMYEMGRHIFWQNNELAGEAAVMNAFQCFGKMPYNATVAVIGSGNTAKGAIRVLNMFGANVMQYNRKKEELFKEEIYKYDAVVNCVTWDLNRKDHIINRSDLKRMKNNSLIIDVSCDKNGAIETSVPTTINNPTYTIDGIMHYVVDHTPAIFYKTFTSNNSSIIYPFIEQLIKEELSPVLVNATIIDKGIILDKKIKEFQNRE
jgi:N5-(carboxyethyl)ornithine synthase